MTLSTRNRDLLERKFGKRLPIGDAVVKLKLSDLGKILDAARADGPAVTADPDLQAGLDAVFGRAR